MLETVKNNGTKIRKFKKVIAITNLSLFSNLWIINLWIINFPIP